MKQPIFLKPVLHKKIWGGNKLKINFGLPVKSDKVGEAWMISAHPNGITKVISPNEIQGLFLDELFRLRPELFNFPTDLVFPLLVKLIDASDALSVQVHPSDIYAKEHEGGLGKTECWYVLSAELDSKIIYGHTAQTREEFINQVNSSCWKTLLNEVPVKTGDFFYVPHGTLHAIGKGIVILEIQQSSDTTYRVFDYHRKDDMGNERELHLDQAYDVTMIPHQSIENKIIKEKVNESNITHYLSNDYFSVYKWDVKNELAVSFPKDYYLAIVIAGEGHIEIEGSIYSLSIADSFIIPAPVDKAILRGNLEIMVSNPEKK
ncbi:mannose-6-phosphate isomerase, class I [Aerococcaceae bacterium zg-BR22]|uniref:mannose-6-phosphate isomerase, class I n=1 Tax=Aerococcaceae bacterium zg-1292 TaxID=2774330 RepID=UPI0040630F16|nr:mannose-6-phosphate isomerase, class I [Aerococcaceae bacterium zg-BR22]